MSLHNKCGHGKTMDQECSGCVKLYAALDRSSPSFLAAMVKKAVETERARCASIATELARTHSKGGFNALGFNIAIAIESGE